MIDFQKLRHEWKTFTLAWATTAVGLWDLVANAGYDLTPIVPEKYRPVVVPIIGVAFLLLRKYKDRP